MLFSTSGSRTELAQREKCRVVVSHASELASTMRLDPQAGLGLPEKATARVFYGSHEASGCGLLTNVGSESVEQVGLIDPAQVRSGRPSG